MTAIVRKGRLLCVLNLHLQILHSAIEMRPVIPCQRRRSNGILLSLATIGGIPDVLYETTFR